MPYMQIGIDTISYYHKLSHKQKKVMLEKLKMLPGFKTVTTDYWEKTYKYTSNSLVNQGLRLKITCIKGSSWGLYVVIHPALLLGEADPSALYQAQKRSYMQIIKAADKILESVNVPCSLDDMSLYRIDVTLNCFLTGITLVNEYIRLLKKSRILHDYSLDWFREGEYKAKDCKEANRHSYKQKCRSAAFFAYDKTAQLKMIDQFPDTLIGKDVLRIEGQFRPKALKKWLPDKATSNWQIVRDTHRNASKILKWYIDRIQPKGDILRYKDAVEQTESAKLKDKIRERMLYLLRKASDKDTLSAALKDLQKKYRLTNAQCNTILKNFRQLGISPITLRNDSEFDVLPAIREFVRKENRSK